MSGARGAALSGADTVQGLLDTVSARLASAVEARWIVAHAAAIPPGRLLASLGAPVSPVVAAAADAMTTRRVAGEPLQYVIGTWSFRELDVRVDARALIPRPETEVVVDVALDELRRVASAGGSGPPDDLVVADLGTGSGVIALSLAVEGVRPMAPGTAARRSAPRAPGVRVWATDVSPEALAVARLNLSELAVSDPSLADRVELALGSWFDALPPGLAGRLHLVVSNPPYVSAAEWRALEPEVRDYEPRTALVPGDTGVEAVTLLLDEARRWLVPGGGLVLELAPHQALSMADHAGRAGYGDVDVRRDLAGRDRILVARWPGG